MEQRRHGIFKIEFLGTRIVALSAKTYCAQDQVSGTTKAASKGISKRMNNLNFEQYHDALSNCEEKIGENRGFKRTKEGEVYMYKQKKVALSPYYIKRLVDENMIDTKTIRFFDERI